MNNIAGKTMEKTNINLEKSNTETNTETNTRKLSPTISITSIQEDGSSDMIKYSLTNKELTTLKTIYEYIMQKRIPDFFIESSSYKQLMNRNLVMFSQSYKNVVLTNISEIIVKSKKESGRAEFEGEEEEERVVVEWKGF